MALGRIAVLTSGGDAPGMNAALRAVVRLAAFHEIETLGVISGYHGLIEDDFIPLGPRDVSNIIQRGGTIIRTARSERFRTVEGREQAAENLRGRGVEGLVVIGGDGSFSGGVKLAEVWDGQYLGVPGTIDNDIYGTDYTIGFDTAVNTALDAIDKIRDTAEAHQRIFLIEVMGRSAGFIALAVGTAGGAEDILIPETKEDLDSVAARLRSSLDRGKRSNLLVVAEGDELGGAPGIAARLNEQGFECRAVVLGHLQRGGSPSGADRVLATQLGALSVEALRSGETGFLAGIVGGKPVLTSLQDAVTKRKPVDFDLVTLAQRMAI